MGGGAVPKLPDWRIYTVGEHTPELLKVQKMLGSMGLKDPWLRNEVWRYDPNTRGSGGNLNQRKLKTIGFRGMKIGFALAVLTAGLKRYVDSQSHGHH
eukprot:TRINITY_DN41970_c0_g1_i1.p1 TRINITY_DN41970_c0_g1~~TRINITY_DN41970_c0_g1_i1.p1  ORF type:complete len:114 (+),score=12.81 TRINITY_DN41970_c0_g1_i1:51-344(+)